jgi:hypothetical protein
MLSKRNKIFILFILIGIQMMFAQEKYVSGNAMLDRSVPVNMAGQEDEIRHLYVKTNSIGWGFLIANLAGEIDLGKHWSFALPVYYSACNYFTSKVKFRTITMQPEVRYWFNDSHSGWYTGAHGGISWFNMAIGGDFRYQDHGRCTPALGGGLNGGYRMPLGKNGRWWMEFSLGAGVYKVDYDKFQNRKNGEIMAYVKQVTFTVDQLAVSFAYRFDWKK